MSEPTIVIDTQDPTPAYEQIRRQVVDLVRAGLLVAGDRLPSVRQLAGDLGLAPGTVMRAYAELESSGLVRSRRGGGTRVADTAAPLPTADRHRVLAAEAAALVRQARHLGLDDAAVLDAVQAALTVAAHDDRPHR